MKGLFFLFLSVLCLNSYSQNNINPALLFQVSGVPSASGNVYTVSGNTQETTGAGWNASTVAVGDSLFYYDSGNIYPLVVSSIISASGNALSITATSIAPFVSTSPSNGNLSGAIVITRKYSNGTCPIPSNLNAPLAAALESRNKTKVQAKLISGTNLATINSNDLTAGGNIVISGSNTIFIDTLITTSSNLSLSKSSTTINNGSSAITLTIPTGLPAGYSYKLKISDSSTGVITIASSENVFKSTLTSTIITNSGGGVYDLIKNGLGFWNLQ